MTLIQPLGNRVLVEYVEITESPIIIPDVTEANEYAYWKVVAIGPGEGSPWNLKMGDLLIVHPTALYPLKATHLYDNRRLAFADVKGIFGIVSKTPNTLIN